jgi:hypothetical protein
MAGESATNMPVSSATSSIEEDSSSTIFGAGLVGGGGSLHESSFFASLFAFAAGAEAAGARSIGGTKAGVPTWVGALAAALPTGAKGPRAFSLAATTFATAEGAEAGATIGDDDAAGAAGATIGDDDAGATFTGAGVAESALYDGLGVGGAIGTYRGGGGGSATVAIAPAAFDS